jgi:acetyltransferase-like isoleucine patch superfamily enzyme
MSAASLKTWVKSRETPLSRFAYCAFSSLKTVRVPVIRPLHRTLYAIHLGAQWAVWESTRILWYTPLFVSRLETAAPDLLLYGGMPQVIGPLRIRVGRGSRISGKSTFIGRSGNASQPLLDIGDNVDVGWQNTFSVGTRIEIGDNVRLAGKCTLAGFPGHPMDAADRAAGLPDTPDQIGDIVLERDVWLATGVTVVAGVRIGAGTVVATGSVVTRNLPPGVLAAGVPARVVRTLQPADKAP